MAEITVTHEYNGTAIAQRVTDEYVDATALCQSEGKELSSYLRAQGNQKYIEALAADLQISRSELIQIAQGNGGHTYVHPEVAMDIGDILPTLTLQVQRGLP